jgi:hypothetical protein
MVSGDSRDIQCGALLAEWFDVEGGEPDPAELVRSIEQDRPHYIRRPGFVRKLLPISVDPHTGKAGSGGFYLFKRLQDTDDYFRWTESEYRADGLLFRERPFVGRLNKFVGRIVGARDFRPIGLSHASLRFQLWNCSDADAAARAARVWPELSRVTETAGFASVWLAADTTNQLIGAVTVASRTPGIATDDYSAWGRLADVAELDELRSLTKVRDLTLWVFTIWLPAGDNSETSWLWPNSPPLPAPPRPAAAHR